MATRIVSGKKLLGFFSEMLGEDPGTVRRITISAAYDEVVEITVEKLGTEEIEGRFLNYQNLENEIEAPRDERKVTVRVDGLKGFMSRFDENRIRKMLRDALMESFR